MNNRNDSGGRLDDSRLSTGGRGFVDTTLYEKPGLGFVKTTLTSPLSNVSWRTMMVPCSVRAWELGPEHRPSCSCVASLD